MKKFLLLTVIILTANIFINKIYAETAKEVIETCMTAMKYEKLDSFKTLVVQAYQYAQGKKQSIKIFNKDDKIRFEFSAMGNEEAYVYAEDNFFKIKPDYEEMDKEDAAGVFMLMQLVMPNVKTLLDTNYVLKLDGTEDFNGKSCKKISVAMQKTPDEIIQYVYIDAITNWFSGTNAPKSIGVTLEKMKKHKGYVYPAVIKLTREGKKLAEIEIDKLEADVEIDDALFAKPNP